MSGVRGDFSGWSNRQKVECLRLAWELESAPCHPNFRVEHDGALFALLHSSRDAEACKNFVAVFSATELGGNWRARLQNTRSQLTDRIAKLFLETFGYNTDVPGLPKLDISAAKGAASFLQHYVRSRCKLLALGALAAFFNTPLLHECLQTKAWALALDHLARDQDAFSMEKEQVLHEFLVQYLLRLHGEEPNGDKPMRRVVSLVRACCGPDRSVQNLRPLESWALRQVSRQFQSISHIDLEQLFSAPRLVQELFRLPVTWDPELEQMAQSVGTHVDSAFPLVQVIRSIAGAQRSDSWNYLNNEFHRAVLQSTLKVVFGRTLSGKSLSCLLESGLPQCLKDEYWDSPGANQAEIQIAFGALFDTHFHRSSGGLATVQQVQDALGLAALIENSYTRWRQYLPHCGRRS